ncbi:YidC/Oxa1 family membrane protein insertase [Parasutterella secunda]|uniref:YidC/Oxa1 family membrane protein insertase n=1 Tax=Parasutterella secunda TaxID=626947 RepID=UPI0025A3BFA5|nr:YidC/Oxa1 family membrane protein insertase [Parasutterella secunda]MDM8218955.1 YidC/Oxa1 family membrane protein insertase [Parasutterella secunda]
MTDILNFLILTFQGLYSIFADLVGFGWGLIVLSVFSSFLFSPLEKWASGLKNDETIIQKVLQPQIQEINNNLSGQEAWAATQRLYNRYSYHPLKAIRTAAFPLLQLPILFLAYVALSSMTSLRGVSFGAVADLSQPDNLLFDLALLPFLMTAINIAITFVGSFTKKERIQAVFIALFFLVLLYPAPSALLIYWTSNNFIGLVKVLYQNFRKDKIHTTCINKRKKLPAWIWTLPLCPFVPALFLWANNVAYYPIASIFASILFITIASSICFFFLYLISRKIDTQNKIIQFLFFSFYCLFCGFVICALGYSTILGLFYDYRFYTLICFPLLLTLVTYKIGFRVINCLLVVQLSVSILLFCFNYGTDKQLTPLQESAVTNIPIFKNKPNIYYFLCESYHNLDYVKDVFGYDSTEFLDNIKKYGYTVYNNIYSNSSYTLGTLTNIFTMSTNSAPNSSSLALDASSWERSVIGGGSGNKLLEILKQNGYETSMYFKGSSYYFKSKGKFLDYTDVHFSIRDLLQPIEDTNGMIPFFLNLIFPFLNNAPHAEQDSLNILKKHLIRTKDSSKPQFFVHRLDKTNHTPPIGYNFKQRENFIDSHFYQDGIATGNAEIEKIIKTIEKYDPNSIVIFLGDHGAWTLRGLPLGSSFQNLVLNLSKENLTLDMLINDMFYVFAAVKLPNNVLPLEQFSPADIFSQIFDRLCYQQTKSYNSDRICVKLTQRSQEFLCKKQKQNLNNSADLFYPSKNFK